MNEQEAREILTADHHGPLEWVAKGFLEAHNAAKEREAKLREEIRKLQEQHGRCAFAFMEADNAAMRKENARLRAVVERLREELKAALLGQQTPAWFAKTTAVLSESADILGKNEDQAP